MKAKTVLQKDFLYKKASLLKISAFKLADSIKSGNFRSLFKSQGVEFSGVRNYILGDDVRLIDWNVTARMSEPYVKMYEEEREIQFFLITDQSKSMFDEDENGKSKYECALELSALILFACEHLGASSGAVFFDGKINFSISPQKGKNQTMILLKKLEEFSETKNSSFKNESEEIEGTALNQALKLAQNLILRRNLIFVISDFKVCDWEKNISILCEKNDVIAIKIQNKNDSELPDIGNAFFEDVESKNKFLIRSNSKKFKKFWKEKNQNEINSFKLICTKHKIIPVVMNSYEDCFLVLNDVFSKNNGGQK